MKKWRLKFRFFFCPKTFIYTRCRRSMCESKVLSADGRLLMEDVVRIKVEGSLLKMWDILGATKEVRGRILEVDLVAHRVKLEVL